MKSSHDKQSHDHPHEIPGGEKDILHSSVLIQRGVTISCIRCSPAELLRVLLDSRVNSHGPRERQG